MEGDVMTSKADEVLKRFESLNSEEEEKEHSLQENAKARAQHPTQLNAGTAFDWEELEAYQKELDRMDREGAAVKK
jgi:hypothetical protein